ncbi:bsl1708 [Bradyrhizobium diazoefficiens USDA 110]|uniref:Bsl1708 protein n=1 Tax=Bradyrhizobium diazoefficiens (strain JCM 10833 / BCRC 13528 / IAM 13628 / NBRC 14792 / USDA 110) TaxID=224911 RepID=Q89TS7_BRADU|nr:hypothetical protein Bdiaspc4_08670 [Bradyrhizobium diazoefficiens]BAC46973.1 bsl1708 [Bradyrhizobium diazoefficiens USDA 110]
MGSTIADGLAHRLVVRRLQPILQIALQPSCARFLVLADGRMIFGNGLLLFLILSFCETSSPTYCFIAPPIYSATIWVGRARRSGWRVSVAAR